MTMEEDGLEERGAVERSVSITVGTFQLRDGASLMRLATARQKVKRTQERKRRLLDASFHLPPFTFARPPSRKTRSHHPQPPERFRCQG